MKPFRIYEVVDGGLQKWYNYYIKYDYDSLEEAEVCLNNYISMNRQLVEFNKQFVIQEYTSKHTAKIVKVIDPI